MCGWKGDLRQSCPLFVSGLGKLATRSKDKTTNKTKHKISSLKNLVFMNMQAIFSHLKCKKLANAMIC